MTNLLGTLRRLIFQLSFFNYQLSLVSLTGRRVAQSGVVNFPTCYVMVCCAAFVALCLPHWFRPERPALRQPRSEPAPRRAEAWVNPPINPRPEGPRYTFVVARPVEARLTRRGGFGLKGRR